jgi:hypothetical protein
MKLYSLGTEAFLLISIWSKHNVSIIVWIMHELECYKNAQLFFLRGKLFKLIYFNFITYDRYLINTVVLLSLL